MTTLHFTVTFHSPFRVGSSYARDGIDAAIDHDDPLPADHLKGLMRAAAGGLLHPAHPLVARTFGTTASPSAWSWTSAEPTDGTAWEEQDFTRRHRVKISPETGTATKDLLVLGEQVWTPQATFEIHRTRPISNEQDEVTLLRLAACTVHAVGAWRRRGLGWVGISQHETPVTTEDVGALLRWREETL